MILSKNTFNNNNQFVHTKQTAPNFYCCEIMNWLCIEMVAGVVECHSNICDEMLNMPIPEEIKQSCWG